MVRTARQVELARLPGIVCAASCLLFVVAIISGGLMSTDKTLPPAVKVMHRLSPFLTVFLTAMTLYCCRDLPRCHGHHGQDDSANRRELDDNHLGMPGHTEEHR